MVANVLLKVCGVIRFLIPALLLNFVIILLIYLLLISPTLLVKNRNSAFYSLSVFFWTKLASFVIKDEETVIHLDFFPLPNLTRIYSFKKSMSSIFNYTNSYLLTPESYKTYRISLSLSLVATSIIFKNSY